MFSTLVSATLVSVLAIQGARAAFTIDTPVLTQCQDTHITWSQSQAPYNLLIVPSADPCGDSLADLGDHNGLSMTWKVNLAAGTKVMLSLEDGSSDEAWSADIVVQPSNDTSCLSGAAASSVIASASAAASSIASAIASASAVTSAVPTTLSIAYTGKPASVVTSAVASGTSSSSGATVSALGAANAGANPFSSGAPAARSLYKPAMIFGALGAALAIAL
ncbi:hypothetical protein HETIRDRAFT_417157 [Heterobasidion irregulare TC 32-1]|uniref:Uncharacterized protein n=1 Tax=Heterobasidion irregulare (strain TC 32-1) TaxID=747525 RepID=W4KCV9_HETIT|nr:uncharacterized protein HETIRDRAFT_417157 [Heterobasidion irregulare TC 32-1]ETW83170.1 hypothetical protein HETIRDRAFT_417157 [Heterobasidion irregulare TC 32-1]